MTADAVVAAPLRDGADDIPRLLDTRPALRAAYMQSSQRLAAAAAADADARARWRAASLRLLHVNAGAACLIAFWHLSDENPAACGAAAQVGEIVADICRYAGAAAAHASLRAAARQPVIARDAASGYWRGLLRLAYAAPHCVSLAAGQADAILAAVGAEGFADFVDAGLKAAPDRKRRAAFFALRDDAARRLLEGGGAGGGFTAHERALKLYATALWGRVPILRPLAAARRTRIADGVTLLPESLRGTPAPQAALLYRAMVAHAGAHHAHTPGRMEIGSLKPLQLVLIGLIEDARVEALAMRRFPGLRRLWAPFHTARPAGPPTAFALLARLARALFDPGYADPDDFVAKGRALFDAALRDPEDAALSRRIGGLLGNDIGQRRLQFNAKLHVIEPAYRDDGLGLWRFTDPPDTPADAIEMQVEAARPREATGEDGRTDAQAPPAGRARPAEAPPDERGPVLARYPEWDRAAGIERPDWTTLRDAPPRTGDARAIDAALDSAPGLRRRIERLVRAASTGRPVRLRRQPEGPEIDIDAVVEDAASSGGMAGASPALFRGTANRARDMAVCVLIDVSQSTADRTASGETVLDVLRLAVALLAEALDRLGDSFALLAFASDGREDVRLTRVKDFRQRYETDARARLAGLTSGLSTRLGAALRHAGQEMTAIRAHRRLVLVLSDGAPSDVDVADPLDLVADAQRATAGLRARGIDVFGITLDPAGQGAGAAVFGRAGQLSLRRPEDLPARLTDLYFRLTRR